jgi:CubicO group peptidase (beta-lactamase class C family)
MQRMRDKMDEYLYRRNFSGAVSICLDQEQLYLKSFGYKDHPNKVSNNCGTLFGIASGTKTSTALGILRLVESGLLDLTTPVTDIIGDVRYIHRTAVFRQLLNHTSGIYDYYDEELIQDFDNYSVEIPWSKLETICCLRL